MIIYIDTSITNKLILFITGILVLIVELINSAIENVVDLVTKDIKPLAKSAKDIGSTAVMFSIILHICCWIVILVFKEKRNIVNQKYMSLVLNCIKS